MNKRHGRQSLWDQTHLEADCRPGCKHLDNNRWANLSCGRRGILLENNVGDGIYAAPAIPRAKVSSHRQIFWQFQIVRPINDVAGCSVDRWGFQGVCQSGHIEAVRFGCSRKLLSELLSVQKTGSKGGGGHTPSRWHVEACPCGLHISFAFCMVAVSYRKWSTYTWHIRCKAWTRGQNALCQGRGAHDVEQTAYLHKRNGKDHKVSQSSECPY